LHSHACMAFRKSEDFRQRRTVKRQTKRQFLFIGSSLDYFFSLCPIGVFLLFRSRKDNYGTAHEASADN